MEEEDAGCGRGLCFYFIFPRPQLTSYEKREDGGSRHNSGTSGLSEALGGD